MKVDLNFRAGWLQATLEGNFSDSCSQRGWGRKAEQGSNSWGMI